MITHEPLLCADMNRCRHYFGGYGLCVREPDHAGPHWFCGSSQPFAVPLDLEAAMRLVIHLSSLVYVQETAFNGIIPMGSPIVNMSKDESFAGENSLDRVGVLRGYAAPLGMIHNPAKAGMTIETLKTSEICAVVKTYYGRIVGWRFPEIFIAKSIVPSNV